MKRSDIEKLDNLWALLVKESASWTCEYCGISGVRMEGAHVVGRRYRMTRWGCIIGDYDFCGHCFCHNCHQQFDEHGPLEGKIVKKVVGEDRKSYLQIIANQKIFQTYEEVLDRLKKAVSFKVEYDKKERKWKKK